MALAVWHIRRRVKSVTIAINDVFEFDGQPVPAQRPAAVAFEAIAHNQFVLHRQPGQIDIGAKTVTVTFFGEFSKAQDEVARFVARAAKGAPGNGKLRQAN